MTDHFKTQGPTLLANGYQIIPIRRGEKRPAIDGWQKSRLGVADLARYPGHGVGILCGQGDYPICGVDIDISHPTIGPALITWCQQHLGYGGERVGAAPRILLVYRAEREGMSKMFSAKFYDPTDPLKPSGKRNDQQVEILGTGQQFVAYHEHPDTKRDYEWLDMMGGLEYTAAADLPLITADQIGALLTEVQRLVAITPGIEVGQSAHNMLPARIGDVDDLLHLSPRTETPFAETALWMPQLPNEDEGYDVWVNTGMALHHEYAGTEHEAGALALWRAWGAKSPKNDPSQYGFKWKSFGSLSGSPMTLRWLLKRRGERLVHLKYDAKGEWANVIRITADEFTLREKVCPKIILDDRLDDMAREALAQSLFDAFKRLGTKYPIGQCRKLVTERRSAKREDGANLPDWATGWVYVTNDDLFYRSDSEEWLTMQGFNARFNRELVTFEDNSPPKSAGWHVLEDLHLPAVTKAVYLPWAPAVFDLYGVKCVNSYRLSSTPDEVSHLSTAGQGAVRVVKKHLEILAGGRLEVLANLIDWLAHNVQQPGVKIRWAPLIKGVEGDGKTILGSLLASVMGRVNVRNVSPKVLGTDFTGWAEGAAVVVLEEIKLTGHNRYDILNALKPFITNDSIEVHPKGSASRDAINTTNYVAFTNYADALPLTDTDRRWWIIFTPFATSAEMAAAVADVASSLGAYFDRLHEAINQHPAELRKWLLDHDVSDTFKPNGSAPMTDEKTLMIGMSSTDEEDSVRDVLEHSDGLRGVTKTLFASRCMGEALMASESDLGLNTSARNRLFNKVGFTKLPKKVKWRGESHTIWVKGHRNMEPHEVREILDKTLPESEKGSESDDLF